MSGLLRNYVSHHPELGTWGIPHVRVLHPMRDSRDWFIHMNRKGIRDKREFDSRPPEGFKRVLAIGDSFLFGFGVDESERFSNLLESSLDRCQIVNLGLCSSGIDQQSLVHASFSREMGADLLLWTPYLNNVGRCQLRYQFHQDRTGEVRITPKPFYRLEGNRLVLEHVPVPRPHEIETSSGQAAAHSMNLESSNSKLLGQLAKRLFLHQPWKYDLVRFLPIQPYPELKNGNTQGWSLARAILVASLTSRPERSAILAPLPSWSVICNPRLAGYRELFASVAQEIPGTRFVDVLPHFASLSQADRKRCFLSPSDNHYSAFGHRIVQDALQPELTSALAQ